MIVTIPVAIASEGIVKLYENSQVPLTASEVVLPVAEIKVVVAVAVVV